ncbi:hypothetical protein ABN147_16175 [Klebsiella oxytoca]|uniref:hypothetical protein n=1 Tax=Klebsiella oxytoca TaxID=571 RepID=UPI0032DB0C13
MKNKPINKKRSQITSMKIPEVYFDIQSAAEKSWLSFRQAHSNGDGFISIDELDSIATHLYVVIHKYGFNGIGTLDTVRSLLDQASSDGRDILSFFDFILRIASYELENKIGTMLNEMSVHLKGFFKRKMLVEHKVLSSTIRTFLDKNDFYLFDERDIRLICGCCDVFGDEFSYEYAAYSLIKESVLNKVIVLPYKNILIEFFRDGCHTYSESMQQNIECKPPLKKGARNKELHSYVIRIVAATLHKHPNASTYALTRELDKHLAREKQKISSQTLTRWINAHRKETGQESQGKHEGYLKLEL